MRPTPAVNSERTLECCALAALAVPAQQRMVREGDGGEDEIAQAVVNRSVAEPLRTLHHMRMDADD